jgi:hypothetical protein
MLPIRFPVEFLDEASYSFAYTAIPTPLSRIRISFGIRENFTVTYRSPAAPDRFMSWTN